MRRAMENITTSFLSYSTIARTKFVITIATVEMMEITLNKPTLPMVKPASIKTVAMISNKANEAIQPKPSLSKEEAIATTAHTRPKIVKIVATNGNFLNSYLIIEVYLPFLMIIPIIKENSKLSKIESILFNYYLLVRYNRTKVVKIWIKK